MYLFLTVAGRLTAVQQLSSLKPPKTSALLGADPFHCPHFLYAEEVSFFLFSFLNLHYCSSFKAIDSNAGCFRTYLRAAAPEGGRIFYIRAMNRKYGCNGTFN